MGMNKYITNMPQSEYRAAEGFANSDLLMIAQNPSDYEWCKKAPQDPSKVEAKDFGTALHAALLEPETFDDAVIVADVKGRNTQTFQRLIIDNPDKVVMTEEEIAKIRIMQASAQCHPAMSLLLNVKGNREASVFVWDADFGVWLKARPDIDAAESAGFVGDLKSTDSLQDWREIPTWKNPLYKLNYGHTAAFYLYAMSMYYGREINTYKFGVCQKSVSLGRYPCSVFTITKPELIELGFWEEMLNNIGKASEHKKSGDWYAEESFYFGGESTTFEFSDGE